MQVSNFASQLRAVAQVPWRSVIDTTYAFLATTIPACLLSPLLQRYREASDLIKKGKMCALFINDLDAGAGRLGGTTQYTVNNQMVNATLMNIADNPTNVQVCGWTRSRRLRVVCALCP